MSIELIERWMKCLGASYEDMVSNSVISAQPLDELYPGRDWLAIEPIPGIELSFWASNRRFEKLFITLIKTTPSTIEYKGELPRPFIHLMTQSGVHATFGKAYEVKGPVKMPKPMGMTGGWESYILDPETHPNIKVVFQYTEALAVNALVFTLIDKGHD